MLGQPVAMPVVLAPTGLNRMAHRDAEFAVARAAADAGVIAGVSTVTSYPLEEIARETTDPKWFQLYPPVDRGACGELIDRAQAAGYTALAVTIDGATAALRERDKRNGLTVPLSITPRLIAQGATRPAWALDFLRGGGGPRQPGHGRPRPEPTSDASHVR